MRIAFQRPEVLNFAVDIAVVELFGHFVPISF